MHSEFVQHLIEDLLSDIQGISARAMFGGYGIYYHKKIFGIIAKDEIYFKAKDELAKEYLNAGSQPFTYLKNNKPYTMCYFKVPEAVLTNKEILTLWATKSIKQSTS